MAGALKQYFKRYAYFRYNPSEPANKQWKRLCREKKFSDHQLYKTALDGYKTALVKQFNMLYGEDDDDLTAWHGLLLRVGNKNPPDTVKECKEYISGIYVNLVDLVDAGQGRYRSRLFRSEKALADYTIDTQKFFPKEDAYAGNLLKFLLRHILNPALSGSFSRGKSTGRRCRR